MYTIDLFLNTITTATFFFKKKKKYKQIINKVMKLFALHSFLMDNI